MLYVVATPIGNLGDISPRALDTLRQVALIVAEDTRVTRKLLNHYDIQTPLTSLFRDNERHKSAALVNRMLEENIDVALVSDAGTPAISDPGAFFVKEAAQQGIEIQPIPGASAAVAAVSISGFVNTTYTFYGFLPRGKKERQDKLISMAGRDETAVLYESPHRVIALMENVQQVFPDIQCVVCCDLTKMYEKTLRGSAGEVLEQLKNNPKTQKGEYAVVLDLSGTIAPNKDDETLPMTLEAQLLNQMVLGELSLREAGEVLQQKGHKKNALYTASLNLKNMLRDG